MPIFNLVLLALDTIAKVAVNPALGLGGDAKRVVDLIGIVTTLGRQGDAAITELKEFTDEIEALAATGEHVDPETWDDLTARRHAQADAIQALARDA